MSQRILNTVGLFIAGLLYSAVLLAVGLLMTGAGHGTGLLYLMVASPVVYLKTSLILPALFWSVLFAMLPSCQNRWAFGTVITALTLHFIGMIYACTQEGASGIVEMIRRAPILNLVMLTFYAAGQGILIFLLMRWRKHSA